MAFIWVRKVPEGVCSYLHISSRKLWVGFKEGKEKTVTMDHGFACVIKLEFLIIL